MRTTTKTLAAAATVALLAACGTAAGDDAAPEPPVARSADVLVVRTEAGLVHVDGDTGQSLAKLGAGLPSPGGTRVASYAGGTVTVRDGRTGAVQSTSAVPVTEPDAVVRAVSDRGDVALAPLAIITTGYPAGRETSAITVVRPGGEARTYSLAENLSPEAFSTDGGLLYVVQFSPAGAPDRYRVRQLDLGDGTLHDVPSPHQQLRSDMKGVARTQVSAPDGKRMYTLYVLEDGNGEHHALVHVLDLDEGWAHCVDLPQPVGDGITMQLAMAVSPDGGTLTVVDTQAGVLAAVDTDALAVRSVHHVDVPSDQVPVRAVVADDGASAILTGNRLLGLDADAVPLYDSQLRGYPNALELSPSGRLYATVQDGVLVVDALDGTVRDELHPSLGTPIVGLGRTGAPLLDAGAGQVPCAC
jgi:DNA-binding beta-propeller fold protein YncE